MRRATSATSDVATLLKSHVKSVKTTDVKGWFITLPPSYDNPFEPLVLNCKTPTVTQ